MWSHLSGKATYQALGISALRAREGMRSVSRPIGPIPFSCEDHSFSSLRDTIREASPTTFVGLELWIWKKMSFAQRLIVRVESLHNNAARKLRPGLQGNVARHTRNIRALREFKSIGQSPFENECPALFTSLNPLCLHSCGTLGTCV